MEQQRMLALSTSTTEYRGDRINKDYFRGSGFQNDLRNRMKGRVGLELRQCRLRWILYTAQQLLKVMEQKPSYSLMLLTAERKLSLPTFQIAIELALCQISQTSRTPDSNPTRIRSSALLTCRAVIAQGSQSIAAMSPVLRLNTLNQLLMQPHTTKQGRFRKCTRLWSRLMTQQQSLMLLSKLKTFLRCSAAGSLRVEQISNSFLLHRISQLLTTLIPMSLSLILLMSLMVLTVLSWCMLPAGRGFRLGCGRSNSCGGICPKWVICACLLILYTSSSSSSMLCWSSYVRQQYTLQLYSACLPLCLQPKMRSIHWLIFCETYSSSRICRSWEVKQQGLLAPQGGISMWSTSSWFWVQPKKFSSMLIRAYGRQYIQGISSLTSETSSVALRQALVSELKSRSGMSNLPPCRCLQYSVNGESLIRKLKTTAGELQWVPKKKGGCGLKGSFAKYFQFMMRFLYSEPKPPMVLDRSLTLGYFYFCSSTTQGNTAYWLKSFMPRDAARLTIIKYSRLEISLLIHLQVILGSIPLVQIKVSYPKLILFNLQTFCMADSLCILSIYLRNCYLSSLKK